MRLFPEKDFSKRAFKKGIQKWSCRKNLQLFVMNRTTLLLILNIEKERPG